MLPYAKKFSLTKKTDKVVGYKGSVAGIDTFVRNDCYRIVPGADYDEDEVTIRAVLEGFAEVSPSRYNRFEFLYLPGDDRIELYVVPRSAVRDEDLVDTVGDLLLDAFPAGTGIARGDLKLRILSDVPGEGCRLFSRPDRGLTAFDDIAGDPARKLLEVLADLDAYWGYQVLLEPHQRPQYFNATARIVHYADFILNPKQILDQLGIVTGFEVLNAASVHPDIHVDTRRSGRIVDADKVTLATDEIPKRTLRQIATIALGEREWRRLLSADSDYNELAKPKDRGSERRLGLGYGRMFQTIDTLRCLVGAPIAQLGDVDHRPGFDRSDVLREGADIGTTERTVTPATGITAGGADHRSGEQFVREAVRDRGWAVTIEHPGEDKSIPDGMVTTNTGTEYLLEVAEANETKPGNVLKNARRADLAGYEVCFAVTANRTDSDGTVEKTARERAAKLHRILAKPYRSKDPENRRVRLYNVSQAVTNEEGGTFVIQGDEAEWFLTADGELVLEVEGDELVRTDADADLRTLDGLSRVIHSDGEYRVVGPSGVEAEYQSANALYCDYTRLQLPFVPNRIEYASIARIDYRDGDNLQEFTPTPAWADPRETKDTVVWGDGLAEFTELYTHESDENAIEYSEFRERACDYLERLSHRGAPAANVFGKILDLPRTSASPRRLKRRTWVFPEGIVNPSIPGTDFDPADTRSFS